MPKQVGKTPSPELSEIEKRVSHLKEKLQERESVLQEEEREEKIKEEIRHYFKELQYSPPVSAGSSTTPSEEEAEKIKKFSKGEQVGALVKMALEDNFQKALSLARSLNNPAILDEFHDTLVDHYYNLLVQKGVI